MRGRVYSREADRGERCHGHCVSRHDASGGTRREDRDPVVHLRTRVEGPRYTTDDHLSADPAATTSTRTTPRTRRMGTSRVPSHDLRAGRALYCARPPTEHHRTRAAWRL